MDAYLPLVRRVVRQLARRLPSNVQRDDLLAAGVFGLVDSLRRNGGDGGDAFACYARTRIRGAVFDELRAQYRLSRRARAGEAPASFVSFEDVSDEHGLAGGDDPAAACESRSLCRALGRALAAPRARADRGGPLLLRGAPPQGDRRRARGERAADLPDPLAGHRAATADAHRGRGLIAPGGRHGETGGRHPGAPLHPRESRRIAARPPGTKLAKRGACYSSKAAPYPLPSP